MRGRIQLGASVMVLAVGLLAGCASKEEDIHAWMTQQAQGMRGAVKPLPEIKPFPIVEYEAQGLISPFSSERIVPEQRAGSGGGGGLKPDLNRRREPLEAYPLESLTMVGVIMQGKQAEALIKADNAIHQVGVGNYMGQNFGVVTAISETEVKLRELVEDANGDWIERSSSLLLQEQQGSKQ